MPGKRGVFVTGTDTGVGKTLVSTLLLRQLRAQGLDAGAMKPIETGVEQAGPLDAIALREAAGGGDPLEDVCPLRFALPAAPEVAALAEGREVDLAPIRSAFARLMTRHDWLLVEGAGGLLVPIRDGYSMADLAAELALPVLLVVRGRLGTINHTLLTLAELDRRGLPLAGVVISQTDGPLSDADDANLTHLRQALGKSLLGEVPALESPQEAFQATFDIDSLV